MDVRKRFFLKHNISNVGFEFLIIITPGRCWHGINPANGGAAGSVPAQPVGSAMGVRKFRTTIPEDMIKVINVANWIMYEVACAIKRASAASTAIRKENSLICPSLYPTSLDIARFHGP